MMNQTNRVTTPTGNQKIVFLTQRPQTPSGMVQQQSQQAVQNQQNTVVKFVSNANTQNPQKMVTTQQKLVVVCMPNSTPTPGAPINTQSSGNMYNSDGIPANPSSISVVQKTAFVQQQQQQQQQQQKIKLEQMQIDDLSHLS